MRLLTTTELQLLTREQLLKLMDQISGELPQLAPGSAERANALYNLSLIRATLLRRQSSFTPTP